MNKNNHYEFTHDFIHSNQLNHNWNIIGNTPTKIFDKLNQDNPLKINPGDIVEFYEINKSEYLNWNE